MLYNTFKEKYYLCLGRGKALSDQSKYGDWSSCARNSKFCNGFHFMVALLLEMLMFHLTHALWII